MRGRLQYFNLKEIAQANKSAFNQIVAVAKWYAENERSSLERRPLEVSVAEENFETNPLQWGANIKVVNILWTRTDGGGEKQRFNITPVSSLKALWREVQSRIVDLS